MYSMRSFCKNECANADPAPDPWPVPPEPSPFPALPVSDPQPPPPSPPRRSPMSHVSVALFAGFSLLGGWSIGSAQIAPGVPPAQQSQQVPAVISPAPPMGAPQTSGISAKIITPATTNRLASSPERAKNAKGFRSAGSGLPGMRGGPPLTSSLGARDPRAPTVGPLFCDPTIDMAC